MCFLLEGHLLQRDQWDSRVGWSGQSEARHCDWQLGLWDINSVLPSKYVRGEAGYWLVTTLHRATLPPRHTNVLTPGVSNLCWENILTTNDCICNAASSLHGTVMRKSGYIHSIFLTPYRDIVWLSVANEVMMAAENQGEVFISADHPALATECWDMGRGQLVTSSSDANFYFPGCCHFSLINLNPCLRMYSSPPLLLRLCSLKRNVHPTNFRAGIPSLSNISGCVSV